MGDPALTALLWLVFCRCCEKNCTRIVYVIYFQTIYILSSNVMSVIFSQPHIQLARGHLTVPRSTSQQSDCKRLIPNTRFRGTPCNWLLEVQLPTTNFLLFFFFPCSDCRVAYCICCHRSWELVLRHLNSDSHLYWLQGWIQSTTRWESCELLLLLPCLIDWLAVFSWS